MIPSKVMRTTIALFLFSTLTVAGQKASAFTPGLLLAGRTRKNYARTWKTTTQLRRV